MLTNARITQNEEGYWLQVESKTGSASLNLSIISNSEVTSKALEEWAEEQTQAGLDIQTQIIHEMAYARIPEEGDRFQALRANDRLRSALLATHFT